MQVLVRILVSAGLIALYFELLKSKSINQYPLLAAVLISLPLTTVIAFTWVWLADQDTELIASQSIDIFWLTVASLPMLLVLPWLLRRGLGFALSMVASILVMFAFYALAIIVLQKFDGSQ